MESKSKKKRGLKEQMAMKILVPLLLGVIITAALPSTIMFVEGSTWISTIGKYKICILSNLNFQNRTHYNISRTIYFHTLML